MTSSGKNGQTSTSGCEQARLERAQSVLYVHRGRKTKPLGQKSREAKDRMYPWGLPIKHSFWVYISAKFNGVMLAVLSALTQQQQQHKSLGELTRQENNCWYQELDG